MSDEWVIYNPLTMTYDTKDGTKVPAELVESVACLADVLHISEIRKRQREANRAESVSADGMCKVEVRVA